MTPAQVKGLRTLEAILEGRELVDERDVFTPRGLEHRTRLLRDRALVQHCLDICNIHRTLLRPGAFQPEAEVRKQLDALVAAIDALGLDARLHMQSLEFPSPEMSEWEHFARGAALDYTRERAAQPHYVDVRAVRRIARARFGRDAVTFAEGVGIAVSDARSSEFVELLDGMIAVMDMRIDAHRLARDIVAGADGEE